MLQYFRLDEKCIPNEAQRGKAAPFKGCFTCLVYKVYIHRCNDPNYQTNSCIRPLKYHYRHSLFLSPFKDVEKIIVCLLSTNQQYSMLMKYQLEKSFACENSIKQDEEKIIIDTPTVSAQSLFLHYVKDRISHDAAYISLIM